MAAACAAAIAWLLPKLASADERHADVAVALDWAAHQGCATVDQERAALVALTGRLAESDAAHAAFTVHVDFKHAGGDWIARVSLTRADGTLLGDRELHASSRSCHSLDHPLTLAVGLLIDLEVERQQAALAIPHAASPAAPPGPRLFRLAREEPPPARWTVAASAFGVESFGLLPVAATGVGLSVRVTPPRWLASFFATASLFAPRDSFVGPIGLTMGAWYVTAGACPVRAESALLRWDACAALAGGVMTAAGLALQTVRTAAPMLVGAEASSSLDVHVVGPLALGVFASLLVPFGSHRFYATDNGAEIELHKTWPVIPSAGIELRIAGGR